MFFAKWKTDDGCTYESAQMETRSLAKGQFEFLIENYEMPHPIMGYGAVEIIDASTNEVVETIDIPCECGDEDCTANGFCLNSFD